MLIVVVLSVTNKPIMLNVTMLYVVVPRVIMPSVIMPSIVMLTVVMLSVVAPHNMSLQGCFEAKVICSYPL
jgi:hypothetical protein